MSINILPCFAGRLRLPYFRILYPKMLFVCKNCLAENH
jgi:hypothetical protein